MSDEHLISSTDIANGSVRIYFTEADSIADGNYMAGIKMQSNSGANPILIENDISFLQDPEASLMIIDGEINTTPNAAAIRLLTKDLSATSIRENEKLLALGKAVPNPACHSTSIQFYLSEAQNLHLYVQDLSGKQVLYHNLGTCQVGENNFTLGLESLNAGIYVYTLLSDAMQYSERLVVIK
jgi:hypothetical protein